jgi:3-isopropylmalate/(R)-2-methylmalate dehydratase small subunit
VDLHAQTVTGPDDATHRFEIDAFSKEKLLKGQDDIALTLGYEGHLRDFETRHRAEMPWLIVNPPER